MDRARDVTGVVLVVLADVEYQSPRTEMSVEGLDVDLGYVVAHGCLPAGTGRLAGRSSRRQRAYRSRSSGRSTSTSASSASPATATIVEIGQHEAWRPHPGVEGALQRRRRLASDAMPP